MLDVLFNYPKIGGDMGIIGLLQVLFIGLKLTNFITWYWWTVFSPSLVFIAIVVISSIAALIVMEHEINN